MPHATDRLELTWLVTVRWTSVAASAGALVFGGAALGEAGHWQAAAAGIALAAGTNFWLYVTSRRSRPVPGSAPGAFVCLDVLVLAACLAVSGGVLNPASVFFLVQIVLAALTLGRVWTVAVTGLAVAGYGLQLLAPTSELSAAATMHPQIGEHMRGMWWAFVLTAVLVGALVTRLALAIERRDYALMRMREDRERQARVMSLAAMAAGAAHELSTPLATIAVAAGELGHQVNALPAAPASMRDDVALIRQELDRARRILTELSGRADERGGALERTTAGAVIDRALSGLPAADRLRVRVEGDTAVAITWPVTMMARGIANIVGNALRASPSGIAVTVSAREERIDVTVRDQGHGMSPDALARVGEPFFTTRPSGEGLGLGVYTAQAAATAVGGTLTFDSTPGAGTTVVFRLPRVVTAGASA